MKVAFYSRLILEVGGGMEKYFIATTVDLVNRYEDLEIDIITNNDDFTKRLQPLMNLYFGRRNNKGNIYREKIEDINKKLDGKVNYIKAKDFKDLKSKLSKYDLIYSKNEIIEAFIFKISIGYKGLPPIIFGCHTPIQYYGAASITSKLHNFLYKQPYKFLANGVNGFHTINSSDTASLKKLFPKKNVFQIANPFDFKTFRQSASKNIFPLNKVPKNHSRVLWAGRLTEQKGISDLASLINKINSTRSGKQIEWVIAGTGDQSRVVSELAQTWPNIIALGHVESKDMASVYNQSDIFLSTSKWEGFPYNLLEAQSFGLPVVSYDIPGCNEIINNGQNGLLARNTAELESCLLKITSSTVEFVDIKSYVEKKFSQKKIYDALNSMLKVTAK